MTDIPLKIAAKVYPEEQHYYTDAIAPLLRDCRGLVEFVGEIGGSAKDEFLGRASALLFPIRWEEPFGLVMIEALACGTPVIAWPLGAAPEVVEHGATGFLVKDMDAALLAIERIGEIDRASCRRAFEERFDAVRMAREYVQVYARAIGSRSGGGRG
jgi:glycosyltransferase involved in cell wall biosynthesis